MTINHTHKEKRTKEFAFIQWKGGYNIVSEQYSITVWLKGDSIVARMVFDHQKDAAENINRAVDNNLIKDIKKHETLIKSKRQQLKMK